MFKKLGIISDLHMEFDDSKYGGPVRQKYELTPQEDTFYIVAGDIHPDPQKRLDFFDKFKNNVFYVLGNHDFYGDDFANQLPRRYGEVNEFKIAGTTLWTDFSNYNDWVMYYNTLSDTRYISNLTWEAYKETHEMQKKALFESGADIFVTHHCPSYLSVSGKYKHNPVNPSFATEFADKIVSMPNPPKLWIHGHTHDEFDYMIGKTRVICHPRGYPSERDDYQTYTPKIIDLTEIQ